MNIEIIAGSPRRESVSFRVALHLQQQLTQSSSHQVNIIDVRDWDFPLLQDVINSPETAPEHLAPLARRMFAADAFILVTPEYNGTYTAALKNLLDHFPKQSHKAFGVVTASPGAMGGMRGSQQLLLLVSALFGVACPNMLIVPGVEKKFDAEGQLIDSSFAKSVETFLREWLWLAEALYATKAR
ncbi:MAG: NAD(P)H-dependent oxidoreductase [Chitinophagaceae bacterium]|jgi:NAD(P)H-dependent FMN reductase|nr:NAD(P)H-dependent oxidoreductase [Chitinophagaceae bacterium]MCA6486593.1 NAD(P)H-dependent oxidoreductase [Chitinophagaceae bacterium]MCA6494507.1 NAD(P)H-dependent oxidoreductase [Chitinophagaceae bacterium]MCA6500562.1 NAD(P)H-dependent oxidoreductase [Chitinophagaceae bacterium]